jgi:hypothetical protein
MIGLGRLYAVSFAAVSVTAQQDFFYVKPATDKICIIEAIYLSNVGIGADAGDAQEELYALALSYLPSTVTAGTGGSSVTPAPLSVNDAAAGFAACVNDTGKATTNGTAITRHSDGWNVRVPYIWLPPPEHRTIVANAAAITLQLNSTPTDAILISGTMLVREMP